MLTEGRAVSIGGCELLHSLAVTIVRASMELFKTGKDMRRGHRVEPGSDEHTSTAALSSANDIPSLDAKVFCSHQ